MTKLKFPELIEALCRRPSMYTPTGSFYELVSFIEGLASSQLDVGSYSGHSKMTPFLNWLSERLGRKGERFWWNEFREHFGSDDKAFEELPKLYKEYASIVRT